MLVLALLHLLGVLPWFQGFLFWTAALFPCWGFDLMTFCVLILGFACW